MDPSEAARGPEADAPLVTPSLERGARPGPPDTYPARLRYRSRAPGRRMTGQQFSTRIARISYVRACPQVRIRICDVMHSQYRFPGTGPVPHGSIRVTFTGLAYFYAD